MFASPVFSPGDSPAGATAATCEEKEGTAAAGAVAEAGTLNEDTPRGATRATECSDGTLTADSLRSVIAPLEKQISTVVRDVSRLEREKAQWMELYAQSEIDYAAMISRSTNDAARAVAADCDAFVAKVQSQWVAAASRRRDRARTSEVFYAWSMVSSHARTLRRLLSRALERAADNRLRDALAVWMAVCFCGGLREDSTRAGASPLASSSPEPSDGTLAARLEGIAAYAKTLADDFDAASPSKRLGQGQADETPTQSAAEPESEHVRGVEATGRVEECEYDSAESADEAAVQSFLDGIVSGESEAEDSHSLNDVSTEQSQQHHHHNQAQLSGELGRLYDMLAVASSSIDDCDTDIVPSDLVNDSHSNKKNFPSELYARPEAPLASFFEQDGTHGSGDPPHGLTHTLDLSTVEPMAPIHAVCGLEENSDASSTSWSVGTEDEDEEVHVEDDSHEYVPDVACVTIDLEGLMARYTSQLGGSVAFDLENGGLISAFERAAVVQMDTTARAHYVDGLLRLVLYSWVEFTKWQIGTTRAHLGQQEVAGDPADVTVLETVPQGASSEDVHKLHDGDDYPTHDAWEAFSETGSNPGNMEHNDDPLLHGIYEQYYDGDRSSFHSSADSDSATGEDIGFDYESCMPGCFGESYSDDTSSSPDWTGDGDSFLLEQKVAAQHARRAVADPYASDADQHQQEQAELLLLRRVIQMRGDHRSVLRNRWADQLLLDMECSAEWTADDEYVETYTSQDSSFSEQLSEGSGSDAFGSTVAYDGDAAFDTEVSTPGQSDRSEDSSDCTDVDAQADSLLDRVSKLTPEDAELAGLVEESIRTLDTLREAIAAADAATGTTDGAALDRIRCDDLCAQHKLGGEGDQFSPPISPTSPLDCFAAGQPFGGLVA